MLRVLNQFDKNTIQEKISNKSLMKTFKMDQNVVLKKCATFLTPNYAEHYGFKLQV